MRSSQTSMVSNGNTMMISTFSEVLTLGCFMLLLLVTTTEAIEPGNYKIQLQGSYVNVRDNKMYRYLMNDGSPQTWAVDKLSNGIYTIKNLATGKFIPAPEGPSDWIKAANTDLFLGRNLAEDHSIMPKPVSFIDEQAPIDTRIFAFIPTKDRRRHFHFNRRYKNINEE
ncbi:unnamed protein product [Adineta steineri]|uniref:Uncharacterized protein n=1 Tax=Adineta steineri TaxID=433720 RepID=A0A818NHZ1_9BILA|nr:unnamed protein product [Adineta steineri]